MMREVTVKTEQGGVALGRLDDQGRLVYLSGYWYPTNDPDTLDKLLRRHVAEIIHDGGRGYKMKLVQIIPEIWLDDELGPTMPDGGEWTYGKCPECGHESEDAMVDGICPICGAEMAPVYYEDEEAAEEAEEPTFQTEAVEDFKKMDLKGNAYECCCPFCGKKIIVSVYDEVVQGCPHLSGVEMVGGGIHFANFRNPNVVKAKVVDVYGEKGPWGGLAIVVELSVNGKLKYWIPYLDNAAGDMCCAGMSWDDPEEREFIKESFRFWTGISDEEEIKEDFEKWGCPCELCRFHLDPDLWLDGMYGAVELPAIGDVIEITEEELYDELPVF